MSAKLPQPDLEHILAHTRDLWEDLRGKKLFLTGGTGFFGCWLLESFAWANEQLNLGAEILALTRNPESFKKKAPHLTTRDDIRFHAGDVRHFEFPEGEFTHIIHAATEAAAGSLYKDQPMAMLDTLVAGTRRTLDFARRCGAKKVLLTSSGAVYGRQPSDLTHVSEGFPGAPQTTDPGSIYGEGKRMSELLGAMYAAHYGIEVKIARCFAFVGPRLPLDAHFAIGNFIRDALNGGPIRVGGDGTPYRSYLYAADLAIWLWTILFSGTNLRPYNVGSCRDFSITEVARATAKVSANATVSIAKEPVPGAAPARYVPDVSRARQELRLEEWIGMEEGIRRTMRWHMAQNASLR